MRINQLMAAMAIAAAVLLLPGCGTAGAADAPFSVTEPSSPRLAVDGARCPSTDAGRQGVAPRPAGRSALLPAAFVAQRVLVCEYSSPLGKSIRRGALERTIALVGHAAAQLVDVTKAVALMRFSGPVACPADFGTATVLSFEPKAGRAVDLWWATSGCQSLDNGSVQTTMLSNPSFRRFQSTYRRLAAKEAVAAAR